MEEQIFENDCFGIKLSMDPEELIEIDSGEDFEGGSSDEYEPSAQEISDFEKESNVKRKITKNKKKNVASSSSKATKTGEKNSVLVPATKKKDIQFQEKKKVALAVSKHANIYDIKNDGYADRQREVASWKKIAEETGIDVDTCITHWKSLKSSAKYFTKQPKIQSKSGAAAGDVNDQEKFKSQWQFKDVMAFYTPPSLRTGSLLSIVNNASSTSTGAVMLCKCFR